MTIGRRRDRDRERHAPVVNGVAEERMRVGWLGTIACSQAMARKSMSRLVDDTLPAFSASIRP